MPLMTVIIEINLLDWNRHEGRTEQPQTFVAMFHFSHNNGILCCTLLIQIISMTDLICR